MAAQRATAAVGLDALLVTPGSDLRYLTGYDAHAQERLTCLVAARPGRADAGRADPRAPGRRGRDDQA